MSRNLATVEPVAATPVWVRGLAPLAAIAAHLTALPNGFTWLDHGDLERKAALAPPAQWLELFTHGFARTGFYRPLTALSLSLDGLVGSTWMFHTSSVLLHALAAFLLVLAAEALGLQRRAAVLGGVLFGVHWATSLIAAQASFRAEALVAVFLFALVAAHLKGKAVLAGVLLLAAALTKETGLVLGPLFIAVLWPRPRRSVFLAEGVGLLAAVAMRLAFAPPWRATQPDLTAMEAIGTRLAGLTKSALTLLVPSGVCDAITVTRPWEPLALAGLALAALLVILAWKKKGPALLLAVAVLPSLNLVAAPRFWSPHYTYLPWAFAALVLAAFAVQTQAAFRAARTFCLLAGAVSLWHGQRFETDDTLFAREATRAECREANLYLGDFRFGSGDLEEAALAYQRAADPPPPGVIAYSDEQAALQNLGLVRLSQNEYFEAELAFTQALEHSKDEGSRAQLTHNLAAVAFARGDPAGCVRLLEPLVALPGARPESVALMARAMALMEHAP